MSYSELADYLLVLATNMVSHSKLPLTHENIQYAKHYSLSLSAIYPLLISELDKISGATPVILKVETKTPAPIVPIVKPEAPSSSDKPIIPIVGPKTPRNNGIPVIPTVKAKSPTTIPLTINTNPSPVTNNLLLEDEIRNNRRRLLNSARNDTNRLRLLGNSISKSIPQYQTYYKNQYMRPYERFTFVAPRGDGLYDTYIVTSQDKRGGAKVKEATVTKLFNDDGGDEFISFQRNAPKNIQQYTPSAVFTGWKLMNSNRIIMAGVADEEGFLISDGTQYPDDFPRFLFDRRFSSVQDIASLYKKSCRSTQVINGTRVFRPVNNQVFYIGPSNGMYENYIVTNAPYSGEVISATVSRYNISNHHVYGEPKTITLDVGSIPVNKCIDYTRTSDIYFWTLNGSPLHGGIVSDDGYTFDSYADDFSKYKYTYNLDENDAPIPVVGLIALVKIFTGSTSYEGSYSVSAVNDNGTVTLSKITPNGKEDTFTATKIIYTDMPGLVKHRWIITNTAGDSEVIFGTLSDHDGWSYPK